MTNHLTPQATTKGIAKLVDGRVMILFGILDDDKHLTEMVLDVDGYVLALARDLVAAANEQRDSEGVV